MAEKRNYYSEVYSSYTEIPRQDWESVAQLQNVCFKWEYIRALEETLPEDLRLLFTMTYNRGGAPVMVAMFQVVTFVYKKSDSASTLLKPFSDDTSATGNFALNMLVCGNAFSNGENGFIWNELITPEEAITEVTDIAKLIKKRSKSDREISVVLFKEFWPTSISYSKLLKDHKYTDFNIDVNMVLHISPDWRSWEDYLQSLKAKFRTKANATYKRSSDLELRSLEADEIKQFEQRIELLYQNVLDRSDYSFGHLKPRTFHAFKTHLGDSFLFRAAFFQNEMIGFSTSFIHNGIMEAIYVGIDYEHNIERAVYQRLLYDYVDQAIKRVVEELQLGRTSELIKSSLGARPVNMTLYAKHKKPLPNMLMTAVLAHVSPSKFELRQPFKTNFKPK
ncbi:MAG: hypothetical protein HKM28_07235 [Flavobacteriaceae bacterium]|nr:hypothetical protein [Flavobacteriaceae bacterium]